MDRSHGSPFDRGMADYWYHRPRNPHRGGVGGGTGPRIEMAMLSQEEINEYHAGYDEAEEAGCQKEWR